MIIGSGMIGTAMRMGFPDYDGTTTIYAAGVSDSSCKDEREFERERVRLNEAIRNRAAGAFVYFSTFGVHDPQAVDTPYVRHKIDMEEIVRQRATHLIVRLPNIAGRTPNPHTLLNYLFARVSRSERFTLHANARRYLLDIVDLPPIVEAMLDNGRTGTVHVGCPTPYDARSIVGAFERITGKPAIMDIEPKGSAYVVEVDSAVRGRAAFKGDYLDRTLRHYYA